MVSVCRIKNRVVWMISVFVVNDKAGLRAVIGCVNMVSDRKTTMGADDEPNDQLSD